MLQLFQTTKKVLLAYRNSQTIVFAMPIALILLNQ